MRRQLFWRAHASLPLHRRSLQKFALIKMECLRRKTRTFPTSSSKKLISPIKSLQRSDEPTFQSLQRTKGRLLINFQTKPSVLPTFFPLWSSQSGISNWIQSSSNFFVLLVKDNFKRVICIPDRKEKPLSLKRSTLGSDTASFRGAVLWRN